MPKAASETELPVRIYRAVPKAALHPFTKFFRGFDKVHAVQKVFGEETGEVLKRQKVEFVSSKYAYMGVNPEDGHILVGAYHLKNSQFKILYLDIVHELYHVKQFMEGKNLFPEGYEYVDSPIEVPAYTHTVEEAKRIGMSFGEIAEYLKVEWVSEEQHARLVKAVGLDPSMKTLPEAALPRVKIAREVPIKLWPFVRYFRGFERVEAVRSLFGRDTEEVLDHLRVEFFSARFGYIGVNDEDGHVIAGAHYMRDSDARSIYLDLIFNMHHVKRFLEGRPLFNNRWGFTENPWTVDAYRSTVREAQRLGMSGAEIVEYLRDDWITPAQLARLLKKVGLKSSAAGRH